MCVFEPYIREKYHRIKFKLHLTIFSCQTLYRNIDKKRTFFKITLVYHSKKGAFFNFNNFAKTHLFILTWKYLEIDFNGSQGPQSAEGSHSNPEIWFLGGAEELRGGGGTSSLDTNYEPGWFVINCTPLHCGEEELRGGGGVKMRRNFWIKNGEGFV